MGGVASSGKEDDDQNEPTYGFDEFDLEDYKEE